MDQPGEVAIPARGQLNRENPSLVCYSQVNNGVLYVLAYVEGNLHQGPLAPRSSFQPLTLIIYNCTEYV